MTVELLSREGRDAALSKVHLSRVTAPHAVAFGAQRDDAPARINRCAFRGLSAKRRLAFLFTVALVAGQAYVQESRAQAQNESAVTADANDQSPVDQSPVDQSPVDQSPVDQSPDDRQPVEEVAGGNAADAPAGNPDISLRTHQAVQAYFQGRHAPPTRADAYFKDAIQQLSGVISDDESNRTALLFRSLCYGELGLLERVVSVTIADKKNATELALEFLEDPEARAVLEAERDRLNNMLNDDVTLPAQERVRVSTRKAWIEVNLRAVEALGEVSRESLQAEIRKAANAQQESAKRSQAHYTAMRRDVKTLLSTMDEPDTIVQLLGVLANTKLARFSEEEAKRFRDERVAASQLSKPLKALEQEYLSLLDGVVKTLRAIVSSGDAEGMNLIRARFFLGVTLYRQGVSRTDGREFDLEKLDLAENLMRDLAESDNVPSIWRSFASLYLGLIIPYRAAEEVDPIERGRILDEASQWLLEAAELDVVIPESGVEDAYSRTEFIPDLRWEQEALIDDLRTSEGYADQPVNDISVTIFSGAHRDTNVVLLGDRTDLPRGISSEKDFGFSTGAILGYTLDLDDRWTLGLEGRVSSLWHANVDEFDEQNYGGSAAIQYELMEQNGSDGPIHLRLQYDYDYTLLGRDGFLSANRITPNIRAFSHDRKSELNVYFTYELRNYFEDLFDSRTERSGDYFSIGLTHRLKTIDMEPVYRSWGIEPWGHPNDAGLVQDGSDYPKRYLTPFMAFQYSWDQTDGTEFDQSAYNLVLGANVPLPLGIDLNASADFEWEDYREGSVIDFNREARKDFVQRYRIQFSRDFVLKAGNPQNRFRPNFDRVVMSLSAHATFTIDDSNVVDRIGQSVFEYDRALYGISVAFTFN